MPFFDRVKSAFNSGGGAPQTRNDAMVEEVRRFAQEIKAFRAEYLGLCRDTERRMQVVITMLDKPLPRTFNNNGASGAQPTEDIRRIGLTVPTAGIEKARIELEQRLQQEVMANLDRWITDYRDIKAAHRENLTLISKLNDQRKTVAVCNEKYQKLAKRDLNIQEIEAARVKAKQEDDKYNEYQQRYTVREQEVYEQLVQLIKRSALFKDGIAMSFRIFQGAFSAGYQVFEDAHAATAAGMMSTQIVPVAGGYSGPGYHVAEPADDYKRTHSRNNAPAALQSASDYANANPFSSNTGEAVPAYAPQPADPYAPAQYPTTAGYGAAAGGGDVPSFRRTSSPGHSSGSATTPSSQGGGGGYPVKGSVPSAQEKGSTAWVEGTQPAATQA